MKRPHNIAFVPLRTLPLRQPFEVPSMMFFSPTMTSPTTTRLSSPFEEVPSMMFPSPTMMTSPTTTRLASLPTRSAASLAAAVAAPPASRGLSFFQFVIAFVLGGLFFSTVLASIGAFVAVGEQNIRHLWVIFKCVIQGIWKVFLVGMGESKAALRSGGKWNWGKGWRVFTERLNDTRKTVGQGVDAIKTEATLYSAAIGAPGLIPIQYAVDRLLPFSIQTQMIKALKNGLAGVKNKNVNKVTLKEFDVGKKSPKLLAARIYDLGSEAMVFDVDVRWDSEVTAKLHAYPKRLGVRVPFSIGKVCFEGPVRVELTPLTKTMPGFGAILVSFPSIPKISLDVRVAGGDISKLPWLKSDINNSVQNQIKKNFHWPKRIVLAQQVPLGLEIMLPAKELNALNSTDPFLAAENEMTEKPMLRDYTDRMRGNETSIQNQVQVDVAEQEFDAMDANDDGSISKDEYMAAQNFTVAETQPPPKHKNRFWFLKPKNNPFQFLEPKKNEKDESRS